MALEIIATPGAVNANSYATEGEVDAYHESRIPLVPPWVAGAEANKPRMIQATRMIDNYATPVRVLRRGTDGKMYFYTARAWTGSVASDTQARAWPRKGMFDRYGRAIPESGADSIPTDLKFAEAELAGQLAISDPTLDNAVSVLGVTSVKAGPVTVDFKDVIDPHVLPDAVVALLPASWLTDEIWEEALGGSAVFDFEALGGA